MYCFLEPSSSDEDSFDSFEESYDEHRPCGISDNVNHYVQDMHSSNHPIRVDELVSYVATKNANGAEGFREDFEVGQSNSCASYSKFKKYRMMLLKYVVIITSSYTASEILEYESK